MDSPLDLVLLEGTQVPSNGVLIGSSRSDAVTKEGLTLLLITIGRVAVRVIVVTALPILLHVHSGFQARVTVVSIDVLVDIKITIGRCKVLVRMSMPEDIWQHVAAVVAGILVSKVLVGDCTSLLRW